MNQCVCCKIIKGCGEGYQKILIKLDGGWVLNHCSAGESTYLGRLVLQTEKHLHDIAELNEKAQISLGKNITNIIRCLQDYWAKNFTDDSLELVHFAYLNETSYINRHIYLLSKEHALEQAHVHIHIIPRAKSMGEAIGYCAEKIGWNLLDFVDRFPEKYSVKSNNSRKVEILMNRLKELLSK